jgi:tetratricopeptide (TPR) repeat protein
MKYIDLPVPELYDLERDPKEQHNLASSQPQQADDMRRLLETMTATSGQPERRPETDEARQRLRSLGYTSAVAAPAKSYTEADDPKRLIDLDTLLQDVLRLYFAGDLQAALARCRELVARRPNMAVSLIELGHLERASGNLPAAVDALRRAAALTPDDTQTIALLGAYLTQAGRAREAVELLQPYSHRDTADPQLLTAHALALAAVGRTSDALSALAEARRRDPTNAMLHVDSGTVYLMAGDRARAREEFESALAANPTVARAHSSLAVMAAEDGRIDLAVAHWRDAMQSDPREAEKLMAFAELLRTRQGTIEARPYLELFVSSASPQLYAREIGRARQWLAIP